jgi:FkbM family methyltransferase
LKSKQGVFIDIGANVGQTLIKVLSMDKDRAYLGFEPQIDCCSYIEDFVRQNGLQGHLILPVGLSNKNGFVELLKRSCAGDGSASVIKGFRPDDFYKIKQYIYVMQGDDIIRELKPSQISVIKIDVEGSELEVVQGLHETLKKFSPFVIFEVLNHYLAATKQQLNQETISFREQRLTVLENTLRNLGYSIYNIQSSDKIVEVSQIKPKVTSDLSITDYLAIHEKDKKLFLNRYKGSVM